MLNETSQSQRTKTTPFLSQVSEIAKFIETESKVEIARGGWGVIRG